jgi:hypothetical protein
MRSAVAWVITFVWAAGYVRKLVDPSFPVPAEVTPVMLLAAGYLFGKDIKEKTRRQIRQVVEDEPDDAKQ